MSLKRRTLRGVAWSATRQVGLQVTRFIVFLVLSRLLEPEAFGLVAMANVFLVFVRIFVDQGFADAIVQKDELEAVHLDTAFWTSMMMSLVLGAGGYLLATPIAALFGEPELVPIVKWLSAVFPLTGLFSTQQAILRRELAFKTLAVRSVVAQAVGGVVGIVMALLGYGVWSLVGQTLSSTIAGVIAMWAVSDWRPGFNFSPKVFIEMFSFGINVLGEKVLSFINQRSDSFLIGYFLGKTELGYYNLAFRQLTIMTSILTGATATVAFPAFSRMQNMPERLKRGFIKTTQITSLVAFPAFIGLALVAPELIRGVLGAKWEPSIPALEVLALVGIVQSVAFFNPQAMKAKGKPSWVFGLYLLGAVINVIAFTAVVRSGILAVAVAYVVISYLLSPIPLVLLRNLIQLDLRSYLRQFVEPIVASIVMTAVVLGMKLVLGGKAPQHILLVIYALGGAGAYLLVVRLIDRALLDEIWGLVRATLPLVRHRDS